MPKITYFKNVCLIAMSVFLTPQFSQAKALTKNEITDIQEALKNQGWPVEILKTIQGSPNAYSNDIIIQSGDVKIVLSRNEKKSLQLKALMYATGKTRQEVVRYLEYQSPEIYGDNPSAHLHSGNSEDSPSGWFYQNERLIQQYRAARSLGAVNNPSDNNNLWTVETKSFAVFNQILFLKNEYGHQMINLNFDLTEVMSSGSKEAAVAVSKPLYTAQIFAHEFSEILYAKLKQNSYYQSFTNQESPGFEAQQLEVFGINHSGEYIKKNILIQGYQKTSYPTWPKTLMVRDLYEEKVSKQEIASMKLLDLRSMSIKSCKRIFQ